MADRVLSLSESGESAEEEAPEAEAEREWMAGGGGANTRGDIRGLIEDSKCCLRSPGTRGDEKGNINALMVSLTTGHMRGKRPPRDSTGTE